MPTFTTNFASPATSRIITRDELRQQTRATSTQLPDAMADRLIDAATAHAEATLESTLAQRTRTHIFTDVDTPRTGPLRLPHGPVISVTSIEDANGKEIDDFALRSNERSDALTINDGFVLPLTVEYLAGYSSAAAVPADIRQAVLMHAATLYAQRETIRDKAAAAVPHTLDDFYRQRRRGLGVG